ncbi:hypothetical protein Tco_0873349 [Tanacetum coccineum]
MDTSKRGYVPMQEILDLNKTQGASTPEEVKCMQNVPYASAVGSIMYAIRCTRPDVAFTQNIKSHFQQNPGKPHWTAVKTILFGGNEESKKMQKNLLKKAIRDSLLSDQGRSNSAYERFMHIISMLELYDAKVSQEDANLKFLRSLPSVWHVVATMIRGQPGLDELDFDDLYNNLKVCPSNGAELPPNCASHSDEIICSFFAQQASMPTTHDDEDLLQIDEDAMEEIDIRWQKLGASFSRKVIFAKYQEKEQMGRQEKRIGLLNDQTQSWVGNRQQQKTLTGPRKFDAEPVKLEKWSNAAVLQNEVLNKQRYVSDKSCIGFGVESSSDMESDNSSGNTNSTESLYSNFQKEKGFHSVPPPTGTIIPPRANVSFTGIDELAIRNKVVNQEKTKSSQPEIDRNKVIIEDCPDHLIKDCNLHERTFKQTQTHKPKGTQGSRDTRPVWNNINRVNHSNFSGNSRYPHQKRSFTPSAVLTREGLKSTARPKMTRTVPSKRTANVFYKGTARPRVPHAVLLQSTGRPYYPWLDNVRPRTSSFLPSTRSSTTRTPYRPQRPTKIMKSIWVKKGSTVGSQAVLPQNVSVKRSAMIKPTQTWRPKGAYLDSMNRDNGSYTLKQFENGNPEEDLKDYAIIDSGCSGSMTGDKDKLS